MARFGDIIICEYNKKLIKKCQEFNRKINKLLDEDDDDWCQIYYDNNIEIPYECSHIKIIVFCDSEYKNMKIIPELDIEEFKKKLTKHNIQFEYKLQNIYNDIITTNNIDTNKIEFHCEDPGDPLYGLTIIDIHNFITDHNLMSIFIQNC